MLYNIFVIRKRLFDENLALSSWRIGSLIFATYLSGPCFSRAAGAPVGPIPAQAPARLPAARTGRGECRAAYLSAPRRADAASAQSRCRAPGTPRRGELSAPLRLGTQPRLCTFIAAYSMGCSSPSPIQTDR